MLPDTNGKYKIHHHQKGAFFGAHQHYKGVHHVTEQRSLLHYVNWGYCCVLGYSYTNVIPRTVASKATAAL
jgi:hypothetical protein